MLTSLGTRLVSHKHHGSVVVFGKVKLCDVENFVTSPCVWVWVLLLSVVWIFIFWEDLQFFGSEFTTFCREFAFFWEEGRRHWEGVAAREEGMDSHRSGVRRKKLEKKLHICCKNANLLWKTAYPLRKLQIYLTIWSQRLKLKHPAEKHLRCKWYAFIVFLFCSTNVIASTSGSPWHRHWGIVMKS